MISEANLPGVSSEWLDWIMDMERAGRSLTDTITFSSQDEEELKRQSLRFALYARALTILGTCRILAAADKQLDLRIATRGLIECALHLEASLDDRYLTAINDDDEASRRSRASGFAIKHKNLAPELRKELDDFVARTPKKKRLDLDSLSDTLFAALPHEQREISADATHVSLTSLIRHVRAADGVHRLIIDPALTPAELHQTLSVLATSALASTWHLIKGCPDTSYDTDGLLTLAARHKELRQSASSREFIAS